MSEQGLSPNPNERPVDILRDTEENESTNSGKKSGRSAFSIILGFLFLLPAIAALIFSYVVPTIRTFLMSFQNAAIFKRVGVHWHGKLPESLCISKCGSGDHIHSLDHTRQSIGCAFSTAFSGDRGRCITTCITESRPGDFFHPLDALFSLRSGDSMDAVGQSVLRIGCPRHLLGESRYSPMDCARDGWPLLFWTFMRCRT